MRILAFDTASEACSAAVWADGGIAAHRRVAMTRGHAEALMPMIEDVLAESDIGFTALTAIAVTVGPGSFTGLRTGLAAARGLALALNIPLNGMTTLEVVARAAFDSVADDNVTRDCVVALETRRADLYVQCFSPEGDALGTPAALLPEEILPMLSGHGVMAAGNGAARLIDALPAAGVDVTVAPGDGHPDAAVLATLVARDATEPAENREWRVAPLYVHPPRAIKPLREGRLRP